MFVPDRKGRGQIEGVQELVVVGNIIGQEVYGKIEANSFLNYGQFHIFIHKLCIMSKF